MRNSNIEIGNLVRDLRIAANMSQEEFAEKLHICKDHCSRIERGSRSCSLDLAVDIAELFNVSLDFLILGKKINTRVVKSKLSSALSELEELYGML